MPSLTSFPSNMQEFEMRVEKILSNYELCLVDLEVMLNGENDWHQHFVLPMTKI